MFWAHVGYMLVFLTYSNQEHIPESVTSYFWVDVEFKQYFVRLPLPLIISSILFGKGSIVLLIISAEYLSIVRGLNKPNIFTLGKKIFQPKFTNLVWKFSFLRIFHDKPFEDNLCQNILSKVLRKCILPLSPTSMLDWRPFSPWTTLMLGEGFSRV